MSAEAPSKPAEATTAPAAASVFDSGFGASKSGAAAKDVTMLIRKKPAPAPAATVAPVAAPASEETDAKRPRVEGADA